MDEPHSPVRVGPHGPCARACSAWAMCVRMQCIGCVCECVGGARVSARVSLRVPVRVGAIAIASVHVHVRVRVCVCMCVYLTESEQA